LCVFRFFVSFFFYSLEPSRWEEDPAYVDYRLRRAKMVKALKSLDSDAACAFTNKLGECLVKRKYYRLHPTKKTTVTGVDVLPSIDYRQQQYYYPSYYQPQYQYPSYYRSNYNYPNYYYPASGGYSSYYPDGYAGADNIAVPTNYYNNYGTGNYGGYGGGGYGGGSPYGSIYRSVPHSIEHSCKFSR